MAGKRRTMFAERAGRRADERAAAPEAPFDQWLDLEGDFATEHSLPSSDPRHSVAKGGRGGFGRLRRRTRA